VADAAARCPRCRTKLPDGSGDATLCPVCGFDLSQDGAGRGKSFAETLVAALPSNTLAGYVVEGVLASGRRRAVLRAHSAEAPDQRVAIKVVAHDRTSPAVQEKLIERARAAIGVRHEALATLLHVAADAGLGAAYFVSELAPGDDLDKRLADSGTLPAVDAAPLGLSVVRALEALHSAGAVHMDVKPAHIVVEEDDEDGKARLVETGFAPVFLSASGHGETAHEPVVGTPTYLAPEQARDAAAASPASDLYSLGATLFHLVAGRPPFIGDSAVAILVQHASRDAPPLKSLALAAPDELARVVDALLSKLPAKRPAAQEVATVLASLCDAPRPVQKRRARPRRAAEPEEAGPRRKDAEPRGPRPLSRTWLAREAMLAAILVERGAATREDVEVALAPVNYSPEAGRPLAGILAELGVVAPDEMTECVNELAAREKRHKDATFGRLTMELGHATRADIDRVLAETGTPWTALSSTLVRAGLITREQVAAVEKQCLRYLCDAETAAHQRAARGRGHSAEAVGAARCAVTELPPEEDRSLFEIMMEQGALTPVGAWALAAEHVRQSLRSK
jgi:serine/threonine protein kinase